MAEETIDQQFIEYIVKSIVSNPGAVTINRTIDEKGVLLELHVDPNDLGRVIGRSGATAKSIRILLRALGVKNDARFNLKIIDTNEDGTRMGPPRREDDGQQAAPADDATAAEPAAEPNEQTAAAEAPAEAPASVEEPVAEAPQQPEESDMIARSRKDLEGLNDLDI